MKRTKRYEFEGIALEIPQYYDEGSGKYIEEYPDFVQSPVWTQKGNPIMFAGEDACAFAEEANAGGCPDCGSCKHYARIAEDTWIGACRHPNKRKT